MAFDPVTLLTISVVILSALGGLMLAASRNAPGCVLLRWSGCGFLCLGAGFALLLSAPTDIHAPLRVFGNAAFMLSNGLLWGAARRFDHRPAPFEAMLAGALVWLLAACLFDPSQGARIALTSAIIAAYSGATAFEHHRGRDGLPTQRYASWVLAGHAAFFALRTVFGPTFGFSTWGPDVAQFWGGLLGFETVVFAVLMGVASIGMNRERTSQSHRREALEDVLTGVGNRRALVRQGAALVGDARRSGRPVCLLLMDLDGFKVVNDRHGHPAGDRLLVAFARLAHDYLPPTSLVCRIGGEEFAAVLPGADPLRARAMADEIRSLFAHLVLDGPSGPVHTTVSIGIAQAGAGTAPRDDIADLLGRADLCLYAAKHGGRDRVVAEGDAEVARAAPASERRTAA